MTHQANLNQHVVRTNRDKFVNQNAVTSRLISRFLARTRDRVGLLTRPGDTILDSGAGEGIMTNHLKRSLPDRKIEALEYEAEGCQSLRRMFPHIKVTQGSIYELPWPDDSFDLVTSFEVLEHLASPDIALAEMARVARSHVVLTVPYEPYYRIGNVARGRYLVRLGNTPGHINHWTRSSLKRDMSLYYSVAEVAPIFPWLLGTGSTGAPAKRSVPG